jgi:hypothetical protein
VRVMRTDSLSLSLSLSLSFIICSFTLSISVQSSTVLVLRISYLKLSVGRPSRVLLNNNGVYGTVLADDSLHFA